MVPSELSFAQRLIAQDNPVTTQEYQEYRMKLETALSEAIRREVRVRWTVVGLWLASFLSMVLAASLGNRHLLPGWYGLFHGVLLIVTWVETASYLVRFLPARFRANSALQTQILRDLERQVGEIMRRLEGVESSPARTKPPIPEGPATAADA